MNNAYVALRRLLPASPVLVGTVTAHHADDTSTVVLPTQEGRTEYAAGVAVGSTIRARGTTVPVGSKAFVRDGVIETQAPDGDPVQIVLAAPSAPTAPLAFAGPIADQSPTQGAAFSLDISAEWSGGVGTRAFSLAAGTLPAGLALSGAGMLSGTPSGVETQGGLKIRGSDAAGYYVDSNSFQIDVAAPVVPATPVPMFLTGAVSGDLLRTDDGGATWTSVPIPTGWEFVRRVKRTPSRWIATGAHSDYGGTSRNVAYSTDLSSWTQINDPNVNGPDYDDPPAYDAIAVSPSRVIAINWYIDSSRECIYSDNDGVTWAHVSSGRGESVEYYAAGGVFVRGAADIATSPDGITWTSRDSSRTDVGGIAISGGTLVAVPRLGWIDPAPWAARSTDGVNWSVISGLPQKPDYFVASDGAGRFVICTEGGGFIFSADDGVTWTSGAAPAGTMETGPVTWNGAEFLAVVRTGAYVWKAFTSPTGAAWTERSVIPATGGFLAFDYV